MSQASFVLLLLAVLVCTAWAQSPPVFQSAGVDWRYKDQNGTTLSHYQFRWYAQHNVVRFQQFFDTYTIIWMRDYNEFTSTKVTLYYSVRRPQASLAVFTPPPHSQLQDNSCCMDAKNGTPPVRSVAQDIGINLPAVPSTARAIGTALVDGLVCTGYEFMWDQDSLPVIQYIHEDEAQNYYPVRLSLPHNGRSLVYEQFTSTPDPLLYFNALEGFRKRCRVAESCPTSG